MKNLIKAIAAIIICELAGALGSIFTAPSIAGWYVHLAKPQFAPPNWVFAPVWTTLFALMGIAAFLIWNKRLGRKDVKIALVIFIAQLALNVLWSFIFFGLHSPGGAFIEIIFLWLAIFATIIAFAKISPPSSSMRTSEGHGKLAAWLLAPYILWVTFAAYLNWSIYILNR